MKSKKVLIDLGDNSIAFGSSDFLAYFAAKYFSDILNEDFEENKEVLREYLNSNYDYVISKFILFIVSLANKKTALYIIGIAEEFLSVYNNFEIINDDFALNDKEFACVHQLTKKDRESLRERISKKEAERYEKVNRSYKKHIDEHIEKPSNTNTINYYKCYGLLEIISAMIPDLKVVLDQKDQDRCINLLYKLPIILYKLGVGQLSDNYLEISDYFKKFYEDNGKQISSELAKRIVIDYCRASFLAIIDTTVRRAHTKLTEDDLERKEFVDSDTKKIIRLMASMHDEDASNTFEKYSKSYFEFFRLNPFAKNCISLMVRNYVSWYLTDEKALQKRDFLKIFLKDERVVQKTINQNLKDKDD